MSVFLPILTVSTVKTNTSCRLYYMLIWTLNGGVLGRFVAYLYTGFQ